MATAPLHDTGFRESKAVDIIKNSPRPASYYIVAASSSLESDGSHSKVEGSSSSSKPKLTSTPKNKVKAASTKGETIDANAATKTAKVTRITTSKTNTHSSSNNATSSQDDDSASNIQGLPPNKSFHLLCHIHCTLTLLRKHLPTLLELPALSSSTAQWIYDSNVTVTGPRGEQLAVGLDEVRLLSRALATAATAARRAGSLFDFAVGTTTSTGSSSSSSQAGQSLECEFLIDPNNPLQVMVLWRTRLPSIGILSFGNNQANNNNKNKEKGQSSSSSAYTEFSGKSTVDLCTTTGLVTNLQIQQVKINGVAIIESLGTALAAVRRAARSAMVATSSSIFDDTASGDGNAGSSGRRSSGNPLLDGILNGIQDVVKAVDALPSSSEEKEGSSSLDAPLYVVPAHLWEGAAIPVEEKGIVFNTTLESIDDENATLDADNESSENHSTYVPIPIDDYSKSGQTPIVGSEAFVEYAITHKALQSFAKYGLHQLAGMMSTTDPEESIDASISTETVRSLFTTDAELVTFGSTRSANERNKDSITLLRGPGKVADLYRSLALLREASGGDWRIKSLDANLELRRLVVCWRTDSPLQVEGTDAFIFEAPSLTSSYRLPLSSDGDKEEVASRCSSYFQDVRENGDDGNLIPLKISRIENRQLTVAGVTADSAWAQSFVSAALRSGIAENTPLIPDAKITELLRALTTKKKKTSTTTTKKSPLKNNATPKEDSPSMPVLDDAAAASFYGILRALHNDLPNIVSSTGTASSSSSTTTPAGDFLAETVELRGLLGEVLVRGSQNYRRLLSVAISSLRAAIQTRTVRLAAKPRPTIEVTSKGSIKVNLILALWVTPNPLGGGDNNNQGFGVPLKIEVSSEYIIDKNGKIREHRILESRLNGVLTPGDVFSRWIKGLTGEEDGSSAKVVPSAMESLIDAITWVRSMQDRK
eukprot:CAMPEP_0201934834 /NCGR_PEP_ID=MMETSP0903-20130614/34396_1 /ASSEMBLY_ACC=CAM_ASM_000552 /TAXON_ID=420261 /ORGANISM="Thalassiosira antarctica, Strain CCMP982" /LENGTH=935 /DNA_ID=CAMNT_0048475135 /DNA_START=153 /DNA_END=2961 /DNA_ORIENTATION=-